MRSRPTLLLFSLLLAPCLQAQIPSYVPTEELLGWYPFTGNTNDLSGNGNNGSGSNVTLTTDRDGNTNAAYSFNGANSYIDLGSPFALLNAPQLTLSAWFYSLGNPSGARVIAKEHYLNNAHGFHIGYSSANGNNLEVMMSTNMNGGGQNTTVPINTEEWYHVAMVFDGPASLDTDRLKLYINGMEVPLDYNYPIPDVTSNNVHPLWIGNTYDFASINQWYGKIDDVGIWTDALSAQQIADLYTAEDLSVGIPEMGTRPRELVRVVDPMGRETPFRTNTPLIYIYSDGTREQVMRLDE